MPRTWIAFLTISFFSVLSIASPLRAADLDHISGPFAYRNLAIYLVHGNNSTDAVPLTIDEALLKRTAKVYETGEVNALEIENLGDQPVFVQSGDIIKGGRQDRALSASVWVPPRSGRVRVGAFCVEAGRWSPRGGENGRAFSSVDSVLPSREAKIAMNSVVSLGALGRTAPAYTSRAQADVWRHVAKIQERLSNSLGVPVASTRSPTSLQLALESDELKKAEALYVQALQPAGERDPDVLGSVFAINGKLNSADLYPANGLFRKMWPKLINAYAAEAIGERGAAAFATPSIQTVLSFLGNAEDNVKAEKEITPDARLEIHESADVLYFETKSTSPSAAFPAWIHRGYLAK
jgi:ARG/rhodanese/phosphatase superfamily protein